MRFLNELAAWAPGEHSFTALAEAANLSVAPSANTGISTNRTTHWVKLGKSDVDVVVKCVALSKDPAFLTKMAKDRRATVRIAVARNPRTPIAVLSDTLRREKSGETKYRIEESLKLRITRMKPENAMKLLENGMLPVVADQVARHPKLTAEQMMKLIPLEYSVKSVWGADRTQRMAELIAHRTSLASVAQEVLWALTENGAWAEVAEVVSKRNDHAELIEFLDRLEAAELSTRGKDLSLAWVAKMRDLPEKLYRRIFSIATNGSHDSAIGGLASNRDCPWELFGDMKVLRFSVQALARAIAETFGDEAGVWMLAASLTEGSHTISDVLDVLRATHADAVKRPA